MTATGADVALLASLIAAVKRLIAGLREENAALRARDRARLVALAASKGEQMRAYVASLTAVRAATRDFADVTAEQRRELRAIAADLAAASRENAALLAVAVAASRRIMEVIAEAVGTLDAGPATYSATGATGRPIGTGAPVAVAVSFDRAL